MFSSCFRGDISSPQFWLLFPFFLSRWPSFWRSRTSFGAGGVKAPEIVLPYHVSFLFALDAQALLAALLCMCDELGRLRSFGRKGVGEDKVARFALPSPLFANEPGALAICLKESEEAVRPLGEDPVNGCNGTRWNPLLQSLSHEARGEHIRMSLPRFCRVSGGWS